MISFTKGFCPFPIPTVTFSSSLVLLSPKLCVPITISPSDNVLTWISNLPVSSAFPVYSLPLITSFTSAFGFAFPVILVSVFTTLSIVIFSNLVLYTSVFTLLLSLFPSSFWLTFIIVPLGCFGISILKSPLLSTFPLYLFVPISTIISLFFLPVPLIFVSSFVTAKTDGSSLSSSSPSFLILFSIYSSYSFFFTSSIFLFLSYIYSPSYFIMVCKTFT